jgi:hypothetical protein
MPYRKIPKIDVSDKKSPEFDHWLKTNVSDEHHRSWYRSNTISRESWQDKVEKQMYLEKLEKIRTEKWKQRW